MKIVIAGSRSIENYAALLRAIESSAFEISEVVCGGARGVDALGAKYASKNQIPCSMFWANWRRFGRAAGMYRNAEMAEYWDGGFNSLG